MLLTSSWLLDTIIFLLIGIYALYKYTSRKYGYWKKRGVHCPDPVPIFGNFMDVALFRKTLQQWVKEIYDSTNERLCGLYLFDEPYLMPKDPLLLRNIMVADFNYFVDRNIANPDHCPILAHCMFLQKGMTWKADKMKISTIYTAAKLKSMFPLFIECLNEMCKYLSEHHDIVDVKDLGHRYSVNIISICAFGINAFGFDETETEFIRHSKKLNEISLRNIFSRLVYFFKPSWVNPLKLYFVEKNVVQYFASVFMETTNARPDSVRRNDLIDIIKDLVKDKTLKDDGSDKATICGIALQFFFAGYEPASNAFSFTLYEMALNPDIQEKARAQINAVVEQYGGLTYDAVQHMPYLDNCINETLRKYPGSAFLDRKCLEDYPVPNSNVVIEKGTPILIPVYGLHMDENLYPEPQKYDPDRFSTKADNSSGISYLPFGAGPRGCIGERFGKLMIKIGLIGVLIKYAVEPCKETPNPLTYSKLSFMIMSANHLPLRFKPLTSP